MSMLPSHFIPQIGTIVKLFKSFNGLPPEILADLLSNMTPEYLSRLAAWTKIFAERINELKSSTEDADISPVGDPLFSEDFFEVTTMISVPNELSWDRINHANNEITRAIKAENWRQAIRVGMSLAKGIPI